MALYDKIEMLLNHKQLKRASLVGKDLNSNTNGDLV